MQKENQLDSDKLTKNINFSHLLKYA
jgi:hypothetical protein